MKTIKEHENKYRHIPKLKIKLLILFLSVLTILIFCVYLFLTRFGIISLESKGLRVIPDSFFIYFLISFTFICLVALIKNGFNNLKSFGEGGLIFGLITGLIFGLIFGLIDGLDRKSVV